MCRVVMNGCLGDNDDTLHKYPAGCVESVKESYKVFSKRFRSMANLLLRMTPESLLTI